MPCITPATSRERPAPVPRDVQARLLLDAASRLQAVQSRWDDRRDAVDAALSYNRRLWDELVVAAGDPRPTLPCAVRQSLASLGLYVAHHTASIAGDPRPERLGPLIGINRDIAEGLLGRA